MEIRSYNSEQLGGASSTSSSPRDRTKPNCTKCRWGWAIGISTLLLTGIAVGIWAAVRDSESNVVIKRTRYGLPHIQADNWAAAAYGIGYAQAEDNLCVLADSFTMVAGMRSKYFGPHSGMASDGIRGDCANFLSDTAYRAHRLHSVTLEELPENLRNQLEGYSRGYNHYLESHKSQGYGIRWCNPLAEASTQDDGRLLMSHVTPISGEDVLAYLLHFQTSLGATRPSRITSLLDGRPAWYVPEWESSKQLICDGKKAEGQAEGQAEGDEGPSLASNALAIPGSMTTSGASILLGNPHFPFTGAKRFYQMHLQIPTEDVDILGGSPLVWPTILGGFSNDFGFTHTVATSRSSVKFKLKVTQEDGMMFYEVDGEKKQFIESDIEVDVKINNVLEKLTTRIWKTEEFGFPNRRALAESSIDVNSGNWKALDVWNKMASMKSVDDLEELLSNESGIAFCNTIAADSSGKVLYADTAQIPVFSKHSEMQEQLDSTGSFIIPAADSYSDATIDVNYHTALPGHLSKFSPIGLWEATEGFNAIVPLLKSKDRIVMNGNNSYRLSVPGFESELAVYRNPWRGDREDVPKTPSSRVLLFKRMIDEKEIDEDTLWSYEDVDSIMWSNRSKAFEDAQSQMTSYMKAFCDSALTAYTPACSALRLCHNRFADGTGRQGGAPGDAEWPGGHFGSKLSACLGHKLSSARKPEGASPWEEPKLPDDAVGDCMEALQISAEEVNVTLGESQFFQMSLMNTEGTEIEKEHGRVGFPGGTDGQGYFNVMMRASLDDTMIPRPSEEGRLNYGATNVFLVNWNNNQGLQDYGFVTTYNQSEDMSDFHISGEVAEDFAGPNEHGRRGGKFFREPLTDEEINANLIAEPIKLRA